MKSEFYAFCLHDTWSKMITKSNVTCIDAFDFFDFFDYKIPSLNLTYMYFGQIIKYEIILDTC